MGLYQNYADSNYTPTSEEANTWESSPDPTVGRRIMTEAGTVNVTTVEGMNHLLAAFQHISWEWDPSRSGRTEGCGRQLLDRTASGRGECGWLAAALFVLLRTPRPYGFEQAGGAIRCYSGRDNPDGPTERKGDGFVAFHGGLHHSLPANIANYNPRADTEPLRTLYKWGDHVVVEFNVAGFVQFCDPSYNRTLRPITAMALARISATHLVAQNNTPNVHYALTHELANHWLRHRTQHEANYDPNTVYLISTPNQAPIPPAPRDDCRCVACLPCNIM